MIKINKGLEAYFSSKVQFVSKNEEEEEDKIDKWQTILLHLWVITDHPAQCHLFYNSMTLMSHSESKSFLDQAIQIESYDFTH